MPVTVVVRSVGVVIVGVTGPLMNDHVPVPVVGAVAAIVALPEEVQMLWFAPATAVLGCALTVITNASVDAVHGLLLIAH